ncbi:hypothetical protein [Streptococcus equinus]|uniref:hypothetical protein n=1 Tax=Streptococcus equinus TaxID=1335 RepID=UPI0008F0F397|nr:hypothetical protein [Streptococcus equinus]SFC47657.1 hypothetical protein SAMN05216408_1880 [Streptococcus equinus]
MGNIKIIDNKLMMNSKECIFKNTISKFFEISDEVFVLLKIPFGKTLTEDDYFNLFKLNSEGKVVWKASFKKPSSEFQCSPLVNIVLTDGKLTTVDFMGRQFEVDITTGQLKIIGFTK